MKILHVVLSLECGGLEMLVVDLIRESQKRGIDCAVLCLEKKGVLAEGLEKDGIAVISLSKPSGLTFSLVPKIMKVIWQEKIDIVHTHNLGPLVYGSIAAFLTGRKAVATRHGRTEKSIPGYVWALNRFVVAVSEDTRNFLVKHNRISPAKVRVVYNGIDDKRFVNLIDSNDNLQWRRSLGLKENSFLLINVGRLSPEKDHETLLKTFRRLVKKEINTQLLIVGDGILRSKLEDLAKSMEIEKNVFFLGYRDDVHDLIGVADAYVSTSYREGLSLTILEAMASGKPVVATKIGGTPEAVIDGKNGFLVPCGFPERLEIAIMKLQLNPALRKQMGEAGRQMIEEKFNVRVMTEQYETLYKAMLR